MLVTSATPHQRRPDLLPGLHPDALMQANLASTIAKYYTLIFKGEITNQFKTANHTKKAFPVATPAQTNMNNNNNPLSTINLRFV